MLKIETIALNFKNFWSLQVRTCVFAYRTLRACRVSARVLKDSLPATLPVITNLINSSFVSNCFAQAWKSAEVIPNLKSGAYYCYCAYVLRISKYSDFQSVMLTNTGIFLRGLKLSGGSRS